MLAVRPGEPDLNPDDHIIKIPYEEAYSAGFEDMRRRVPDTTRIYNMIGWKPEKDLNTVLQDVIAEMRSKLEGNNA